MIEQESICIQSILYLGISLVYVISYLYNKAYYSSILKLAATSVIALLINSLCNRGYTIVSWIIALSLTFDVPIDIIKNKISSFKL